MHTVEITLKIDTQKAVNILTNLGYKIKIDSMEMEDRAPINELLAYKGELEKNHIANRIDNVLSNLLSDAILNLLVKKKIQNEVEFYIEASFQALGIQKEKFYSGYRGGVYPDARCILTFLLDALDPKLSPAEICNALSIDRSGYYYHEKRFKDLIDTDKVFKMRFEKVVKYIEDIKGEN
jgi:hypothetical protein